MPRLTNVVTISMPKNLNKAMDDLSKNMDQTRSELIRNALREYIADMTDDRMRFLEAYQATRKERKISMETMRKKYKLE